MKGEGVSEEYEREEQGQPEPSDEPTRVIDDRPPTEAEEYQWHTGQRRSRLR